MTGRLPLRELGRAAIAFILVVVPTMLASRVSDARLM
jgi:uncharacterized paraquat-inducible protein A